MDLAAPGVNILSTVPTQDHLFSDDFETSIPDRWKNDDAGQSGNRVWRGTTQFSTSPTHSLTDSTGGTAADPTQYVANQDNWARNRTGFDLTGGGGCKLTAQVKVDTEDNFDWFTIEATRTPGAAASWQELFAFSGAGIGSATADLSAFDDRTGVFVRFRLDSDGSRQVTALRRRRRRDLPHDRLRRDLLRLPQRHLYGECAGRRRRRVPVQPASDGDRSPDQGQAHAGSRQEGLPCRQVRTGGRLNLYKAAAESTAAVAGGVLTFTAEAGQKNNVTVTRFTDTDSIAKYRITDPYSTSPTAQQSGSRIQPGAGCTRVNNTTVKCPVAGITGIVFNGGDGNDTLNAAAIAIPVTLNGGKGSDKLTGGTGADTLTGGPGGDRFTARPGNDTIRARHQDVDAAVTCGENAGDSDTVQADLSPNDPVTARATNCEVVNKQ